MNMILNLPAHKTYTNLFFILMQYGKEYKYEVIPEYRFCKERRFRVDFYTFNETKKIAIEVQGGIYGFTAIKRQGDTITPYHRATGGHNSIRGYRKDMEKIAYLTFYNIHLLQITASKALNSDNCNEWLWHNFLPNYTDDIKFQRFKY